MLRPEEDRPLFQPGHFLDHAEEAVEEANGQAQAVVVLELQATTYGLPTPETVGWSNPTVVLGTL
jgi:hypothetical protein